MQVLAQKKFKPDTTYYVSYQDKLTTRIFLSKKYIHLNIPSDGNVPDLEYKANPKLNLGLGFSYKNFSLNLFNGFGFLNKKSEEKGKTSGLDFQLQLYPKKWTISLLAEFPKGFFIDDKGYAGVGKDFYYYRGDIKSTLIGIAAFRVPNKEKFSYRAATQQTEWQKKSAGSFLFGGGAFFGNVQGDSALVPGLVKNFYPQEGVTRIKYTSFGPGVGYAHTFVLAQHYFFTGSMVFSGQINFVNEENSEKISKVSLTGADNFKVALGYNGPSWNISANWAGNGLWLKGPSTNERYFFPSGIIRVVVAHRFNVQKK